MILDNSKLKISQIKHYLGDKFDLEILFLVECLKIRETGIPITTLVYKMSAGELKTDLLIKSIYTLAGTFYLSSREVEILDYIKSERQTGDLLSFYQNWLFAECFLNSNNVKNLTYLAAKHDEELLSNLREFYTTMRM